MPAGSKARTVAPAACSAGTMTRLGASRTSSVLGLKVRPSTAMLLPVTAPPQAPAMISAMRRLRASLTSITVSTMRVGAPYSWAERTRARVSLGKQLPPKPGPG